MRVILIVCRILVGSLFVISGLIKANDPLGFSYKLQEYFAESALNLPFLEPYALALAMLACLAEIVLGFAVIFGGKMQLATWSLVGLTLFFGWLTYYTATCDPAGVYEVMVEGVVEERPVTCVTDCGCFGDAMKGSIGRSLTPWESFTKDLILFILILPVFFMRRHIPLNDKPMDNIMLPGALLGMAFWCWIFTWWFPLFFALLVYAGYLFVKRVSKRNEWAIAGVTTFLALLFTFICFYKLPVRDYRPYAVGLSIPEGMKTAEELGLPAPEYVYEYTLVNEQSGEEKQISDKAYMAEKWWEKKEWKLDSDRTRGPIKISDGYEPTIPDFSIMDDEGTDITSTLLSSQATLWLVTYDVTKANAGMDEVSALVQQLETEGIPVIGLSASGSDAVDAFRHEYQLAFPYGSGDEKVLKTIVRSNPGLVLVEEGRILAKWPSTVVPDIMDVKQAIAGS